MIMSSASAVARHRQARGWSQAQLAERGGVSRTEISGIETGRLVPSVGVALRLAAALGTSVEALFGAAPTSEPAPVPWAWQPATAGETRLWRAAVPEGLRVYPVEATAAGMIPHDSLVTPAGIDVIAQEVRPDRTLVMAGCDPLVGLLVQPLAEQYQVRLLPFPRSSTQALDLLRQGLVHVAGIHFTDANGHAANDAVVAARLGPGYRLIHQLQWDAGIAVNGRRPERTMRALLGANVRWVNREEGSAARQTFDTLLGTRRRPNGYGRVVRDHRAVAATVSSGWADAGICIRPAAAEAHLPFIAIQQEPYELCIPDALADDPRIVALEAALRTVRYRQFIANTPGCIARHTGEHRRVQ